MECRIRKGLKNEGNEAREMKVKAYLKKSRPEKSKGELIQVNRSADAGNKISIYCVVRWRRGEMEAQNRKWKDVLFIQFQKTGVVQYT